MNHDNPKSKIQNLKSSVQSGRQHDAPAFAEADPRRPLPVTPASHDHFIAVAEERSALAGGQRDRLGTAPRSLQEAPAGVGGRTRYRAAGDQIARAEIASVRGVVSDQLRDRPVHVAEAAAAQSEWIDLLIPHTLRLDRHFKREIDGPVFI